MTSRLFIFTLLISLFSVSVLGIFAMGHTGGHADGCLGVTAQRVVCLDASGVFDFISFHFNIFKSFSTAIFIKSFTTILLFVLFFAAVRLGLSGNSFALSPAYSNSYSKRFRESFIPPSEKKFSHWLALHENSPAFA